MSNQPYFTKKRIKDLQAALDELSAEASRVGIDNAEYRQLSDDAYELQRMADELENALNRFKWHVIR